MRSWVKTHDLTVGQSTRSSVHRANFITTLMHTLPALASDLASLSDVSASLPHLAPAQDSAIDSSSHLLVTPPVQPLARSESLPPILVADDDEDDTFFIQRLIKKTGVSNKDFEFFKDEDEFMHIAAKTPRSNCVMDSSKLAAAGIVMTEVHAAVARDLSNWKRAA